MTETVIAPQTILNAAADRIVEKGWWNGSGEREAVLGTTLCAQLAISEEIVSIREQLPGVAFNQTYDAAMAELAYRIVGEHSYKSTHFGIVTEWNDTRPEVDEVLKVMRGDNGES